jgi:transcriptional regulator with XRE-family HTH domain
MEIRRLRNFIGLRQIDVAFATGISVARLSKAENGRLRLNPTEIRVLKEFLAARTRMVADAEKEERQVNKS